jgi:hypothetical protein
MTWFQYRPAASIHRSYPFVDWVSAHNLLGIVKGVFEHRMRDL